MNGRNVLYLVFALAFIFGCTPDNPKTQNERLRDKIIALSNSDAEFYELLADGRFIGVAGVFPLEGSVIGSWESVDDNGSFRVIMEKEGEQKIYNYTSLVPIDKGVELKVDQGDQVISLTRYEELEKSHGKTALPLYATAQITGYADGVYVLDLAIQDSKGMIKKIFTEGDAITTEVMVTNAKIWRNSPPIILKKGWNGVNEISTSMTVRFHEGKDKKLTFKSKGYIDKTTVEFEDDWF